MHKISAFDVIGPSMVGPSSSHTAGAVRIGLIARALAGPKWKKALIELHGSFAATGVGHATDRAIVAGLIGLKPDDPELKNAFKRASEQNVAITIIPTDLGDGYHPNTARVTITKKDNSSIALIASSTGGGIISVDEVDGFKTQFDGSFNTFLIWNRDELGFLSKITSLLACVKANIATICFTRKGRNQEAFTLIELDCPVPKEVVKIIQTFTNVSRQIEIPPLP